MVNGVVDIPLLGSELLASAGEDGASVGHFLAGPENRLVAAVVLRAIERRADGLYPLVFHGPSGTGKSHLVTGIAAAWRENHRRRVVQTSAVDFARELAEAIETQAVDEFRAKHRAAELLIIEDLGRLVHNRSAKLDTQEELIQTLDALLAEGGGVIVTASAAPSTLPGFLPGLQSRLCGGLTLELSPPGPEARLALLRHLAHAKELDLTEPVVQVLAEGLGGTAPELAGALWEATTDHDCENHHLDVEAAHAYVDRRSIARQPSLHQIALAAARYFSLRLADMRGPSRRRQLVMARGVVMHLARTQGNEQFKTLGEYFGGRDHTTVLHCIRKIDQALDNDPEVSKAYKTLKQLLWKT